MSKARQNADNVAGDISAVTAGSGLSGGGGGGGTIDPNILGNGGQGGSGSAGRVYVYTV